MSFAFLQFYFKSPQEGGKTGSKTQLGIPYVEDSGDASSISWKGSYGQGCTIVVSVLYSVTEKTTGEASSTRITHICKLICNYFRKV